MRHTLTWRYSQGAFLLAITIGGLAGLNGLGGGEFRLPVLTQIIGFAPRVAIPLNLLISLATLSFALLARNHAIPTFGVLTHLSEVVGLMAGGVSSAILGARPLLGMSDRRLTALIAALLAALGLLLLG